MSGMLHDLFNSLPGMFASFREWGPWALGGAFALGVLMGNIVRSLKARLWLILGLLFALPLTVAALYGYGVSTDCRGVACANMVYAMVIMTVFAIFPICMGLGTILGSLIAGFRRMIDRWVTPKAPHATPAA